MIHHNNIRSALQRGTAFAAALALVVAAVFPATSAFADALNPLTDRSLTLSSGSPGWAFTDGSGNSTYAPPNSGANGQKTGNTFAFKVSSAAAVKAMTFQYCTTSAGDCMGPGDNGYTGSAPAATRNANTTSTSDLSINLSSPSQIEQADLATYVNTATGAVTSVPAPSSTGDNFILMYNNGGTWTSLDGWTMTAHEVQYGTEADEESTGVANQIELYNDSNATAFTAGQEVKVVFFGTNTNYITNPGSDEFFVKINTFSAVDDTVPADPVIDAADVIDGGVTVANVMNQSIQITTKVLETMDFSVGTVDPYTLEATGAAGSQLELAYSGHNLHGPCDPILTRMTSSDPVNVLQMGNEIGEFSLETDDTYSTHSYWRLSSNSSAGATVYYSGVTLSNTVGDQIDAIGATEAAPIVGSEQFGLALANGKIAANPQPWTPTQLGGAGGHMVNYNSERDSGDGVFEWGADNDANGLSTPTAGAIDASVTDNGISNLDANASWHAPRLYPLIPMSNYDEGAGIVNSEYTVPGGDPSDDAINTKFAFDTASNTIPTPIATENSQVVDCVTGKIRYIANIAATTPAGIYTTKVNWIAAPQY